ncbi:MAG: hypothetical protein EBR55_00230 [Chitinophagia bacterium]|nr:hypothetical protein [Chitinophagia bacterium]
MNNNMKGILATLVVASIGYFLYRKIIVPKSKKVQLIIDKGYYTSGEKNLMSFDDNFINAWYEASKNDAPQFTINNVNYLTKGGRVAK